MMNAKEAASMTTNYFDNITAQRISEIEEQITERAKAGQDCVWYNGVKSDYPRVRMAVIKTLEDAGYHCRWVANGSLEISWRN